MKHLKKYIKKFIPTPNQIKNNKSLKFFQIFFKRPNLWFINKSSVSGAFAVGFFCAWLPVPFQMVFATIGAILFNTNLPISIALVWITNPISMPILFLIAYKVGAYILKTKSSDFYFEASFDYIVSTFYNIFPSSTIRLHKIKMKMRKEIMKRKIIS